MKEREEEEHGDGRRGEGEEIKEEDDNVEVTE